MARRFEVTEETRTAFRLWIDGKVVRDHRGNEQEYPSARAAWHVAENWEAFRVPTYAELQAMRDDELVDRASLLDRLTFWRR